MKTISIDVGYSASKVNTSKNQGIFPTAVAYATASGIEFGDDNVYEFNGENFYVGTEASEGSFSLGDFDTLLKYAPLVIYHILNKTGHLDASVLSTGCALTDWSRKEELVEVLSDFTVNGQNIKLNVIMTPQGAGVFYDALLSKPEIKEGSCTIIDIGFNTINVLTLKDGQPQRKSLKGYPGHGVISLIKPFATFLESKFSLPFSIQEALTIFRKGSFTYAGADVPEVAEQILTLKEQFKKQLFNSVLVNEKKSLATSDFVLLAGGGAYLFEDTTFPANVIKLNQPEFSNVRGYATRLK